MLFKIYCRTYCLEIVELKISTLFPVTYLVTFGLVSVSMMTSVFVADRFIVSVALLLVGGVIDLFTFLLVVGMTLLGVLGLVALMTFLFIVCMTNIFVNSVVDSLVVGLALLLVSSGTFLLVNSAVLSVVPENDKIKALLTLQ